MINPRHLHLHAQTWWRSQSPSRQRLVALGGGAFITILFWLLIISPWINLQDRLDKALPRLRGELAKIHALAGQINSLPQAAQSTIDRAQLRTDLLREFAASGASLTPDALREDEQQRLHLSIPPADFDATLEHLASILRKYPLKIVSTQITRTNGAENQIRASFVFELPRTP